MRALIFAAVFAGMAAPVWAQSELTADQEALIAEIGPLNWDEPASVAAAIVENCFGDDCYDLFTSLCQYEVDQPGTTLALMECRSIEAEAWQREVDATTALLSGYYADATDGTKENFAAFIAAWEAYREARCAYALGMTNGTMTSLSGITCLAEVNAAQARFLSLYDN